MSMQEFIFSEKDTHRAKRHVAFMVILGIAFFFQSIVPGTSIYWTAFFSLCCFFSTCIFSIYTCLNYLHPTFLQKKKYGKFLLGFTAFGLIYLIVNYLTAGIFLQLAVDFGKPGTSLSEQLNLSFINTSHALIIGGLALGIKFAKNLYLQQKENSLLARQKIITDLRLEKARIYPRLLYQSLDKLRSGIVSDSVNASSQLLKVSDLLSYILYDNDENWVLLEKELNMMQHLIDIGRSGRNSQIEMRMKISGDPTGKYIVPMTLFSLLENCFTLMEDNIYDNTKVDLDIEIKTGELSLILTSNKPGKDPIYQWRQLFSTTCKRLDALYPSGCQYKIIEEDRLFILQLVVLISRSPEYYERPIKTKTGVYEEA